MSWLNAGLVHYPSSLVFQCRGKYLQDISFESLSIDGVGFFITKKK